MRRLKQRKSGAVTVLAIGLALGGCGDDGPNEPSGGPFQGVWSGTYTVTNCTVGQDGDPALCDELFQAGFAFILELALNQDGDRVFGDAAQGQLMGTVEGDVTDGTMTLAGQIGGPDQFATSSILDWETRLVGDTLFGDWRFRVVDNSPEDLGTVTVEAALSLFGESVPTAFGCPVAETLVLEETVEGELEPTDCQLPVDASFFDPFLVMAQAGDSLMVTMRSDSLDAFLLMLEEGSAVPIAADDDRAGGPNGTNAHMVHGFAEGGTFFVLANSATGGEVGPYTLTATLNGTSATSLTGPAPGPAASGRVVGKTVSAARGRIERLARAVAPPLMSPFGTLNR